MYEVFGEFDSAEEINEAVAKKLAEGDTESIIKIAIENGIDKEDAEDYIDGVVDVLVTPLMAAVGKIKIECEHLKVEGILIDWRSSLEECCIESEELCKAVRKKDKSVAEYMSKLLKYAFENKVKVSDEIISQTKIKHNGKEENMRGPVYMGVPNRVEVKKLMRKYYLGTTK